MDGDRTRGEHPEERTYDARVGKMTSSHELGVRNKTTL